MVLKEGKISETNQEVGTLFDQIWALREQG